MKIATGLIVFSLLAYIVTPTQADTFGSGANTFDVEFVPVGNANNPDDTLGNSSPVGKVEYGYRMGKYEISQEMIDKATASGMTNVTAGAWTAARPAADMSWYEVAAFVNWLNTSGGHQAAYDLTWTGSAWSMNLWSSADAWQKGGENRFRHKDAYYFLPSADEWHKAAYYDPNTGVYYNYPTGSDSIPDGIDFVGDPNFDAVFSQGGINPGPNDITNVGVLSPYGTAGQGGNVWEWEETEYDLLNNSVSSARGSRGGVWSDNSLNFSASNRFNVIPIGESPGIGFRVASIPEPSTVTIACLCLVGVLCRARLY